MNPFQRNTNAIKQKQAIADLSNVRKIMLHSQNKQFNQISEYIDQITDDPQKIYYPQTLKQELKYLKLFYDTIRTQEIPNFQQIQQALKIDKFRLLGLIINMRIKKGLDVPNKQIEELLNLVRDDPSLKQEAMMKTVGCRSIKRLVNISKEQIQDLTPNSIKKALKYQIAADWKFFIGSSQQAILFKKESVRIWDENGRIDRSDQAKEELQQLAKLCQNSKTKTTYANKMKAIRNIVVELQKLPDLDDRQVILNQRKKTTMKLLLPKLVQSIQINNTQSNSNENLSKSVLKKQGIIEQRRQIGKQFIQKNNKNNFPYLNFVYQNKFQTARIMQFQKILGVLDRVYKKILREFIDKFSMEENENVN